MVACFQLKLQTVTALYDAFGPDVADQARLAHVLNHRLLPFWNCPGNSQLKRQSAGLQCLAGDMREVIDCEHFRAEASVETVQWLSTASF